MQAHGKSGGKSDFSRMASGIGKDISSTNLKLGKLAQCESGMSIVNYSLTSCQWPKGKRSSTTDPWRLAYDSNSSNFCPLMSDTVLQELTFIIKQDIANINKQIAGLQGYVRQKTAQGSSNTPEGKQIDEHNNNVVMLLQSKLANTSMGFKDVLEVRTQVSISVLVITF